LRAEGGVVAAAEVRPDLRLLDIAIGRVEIKR
jgi:hypothetical protein